MTNALVTLPLTAVRAFTTSVIIRQAEYCHELAIVQMPKAQAGVDFIPGTPIHLQWKDTGGVIAEWYGYVDLIRQYETTNKEGSSAVCVGTTYPLKEQRQDVWSNVTGDGVAESMASRWRLGVDLGASTRVWPVLPQAGLSDWALLVQLAHDIGFTLYSRGPLLCFHGRTRELRRLAKVAPVFTHTPHDPTTEIMAFTPETSNAINASTRLQLTTIDQMGAPLTLSNDDGAGTMLASIDRQPTFTTVNSTPVASYAEAVHSIAASTEDQRFSVRAKVRVKGDARLHPAMPIYLGGLPVQWNGQWFVLSVDHVISPQSTAKVSYETYYCDLLVGRDGTGVSNEMPTNSDIQHTDDAIAEIGPSGLWQCGPIPLRTPAENTPMFVLERLARSG